MEMSLSPMTKSPSPVTRYRAHCLHVRKMPDKHNKCDGFYEFEVSLCIEFFCSNPNYIELINKLLLFYQDRVGKMQYLEIIISLSL